jgi:hypothetical protein
METVTLEDFVSRRASMGSPAITGRRIFRPHAVNAPVTSKYYTLEMTIGAAVYRIPGFVSERAAEDAFSRASVAKGDS